jgi:hypothetical protein
MHRDDQASNLHTEREKSFIGRYALLCLSVYCAFVPLFSLWLCVARHLHACLRLVKMVEESKSVLYPFKHNYMIVLAIHAVELLSEKDAYQRANILARHVHKSPRSSKG